MSNEDYAAYRGRLVFTGTLHLQAPMHIGSGFLDGWLERNSAELTGGEGEIGAMVLGVDDAPMIPSTTLKGAMRALFPADDPIAERLFGVINGVSGGRIGIATPYAALLKSSANVSNRIDRLGSIPGTYLAQRTAIDDASGTADHNKLFSKTVVGPGATFAFRMVVSGDPDHLDEDLKIALCRMFATVKDGVSLGSGKGDGQGRMSLTLNHVMAHKLVAEALRATDVTKDWLDEIRRQSPYETWRKRYSLILEGQDAFLLLGSKRHDESGDPGADKEAKPLQALRKDAKTPELPGSSLMGALRARAEWFVALNAHRGMSPFDKHIIRDVFGAEARKPDDLPNGATGFAGMLRVISITSVSAELLLTHSVKIDRFTQSPIDQALFATEAFDSPKFQVALGFDMRADESHADFVKELLSDIKADGPRHGLMLGHRSNSGYGWMDVDFSTDDRGAP